MQLTEFVVAFIFGAIFGSFLNVCIYRIPRGMSIIKPRSYCPECRNTIRSYDNVPLVSYLVLRARCHYCGARIPITYFLVELTTALCTVVLLYYFALTSQFFVYLILTYILIIIVFIDIERQEVPDVLSLPGIPLGIILVTLSAVISGEVVWKVLVNSLIGVVAGGGSMFLLGFMGELIFKKESLGGGDVKLMAMIGAFLGWKLVILTFFMAPVIGLGFGLYMKLFKKREMIPYAPYLSMSAFLSLLYGNQILRYLFFAW